MKMIQREPAFQPPLAIIATYNDLDIFPQVLLGLLRDGIHVHVIDNWSSDGTYEAIEKIALDWPGVVNIERFPSSGPVPHFELRAILKRKEEIAAQYPGRWIINQDSDEVRCSPWPAVSLHEGLGRVSAEGFSAIDFACICFRPVDDSFRAGMDPETHFRFFERVAPSILNIKAWRQPMTRVDVAESGGHDVIFPGRSLYPSKFVLKHYPIRNLEQGRRKVFTERLGRYHPGECAVGWHIQYGRFQPTDLLLWNPEDLLEWGRDPAIKHDAPWTGQAPLRKSRLSKVGRLVRRLTGRPIPY
jgi:hypothetical protein